MTPASGRFLLDTNIVIALLDGDDVVLSNLDRAPEVFIPAVRSASCFSGPRNRAALRRTRQRWSDSRLAEPSSHAISRLLANTDV